MDTRSKILSSPEAVTGGAVTLVVGYFDVIRADHICDLAEARGRTPHAPLVVLVAQGPETLLPLRGRAELVAALRMVDYVLTADDGDVDAIIETLRPELLVRLEAEDLRRVSRLKEHVHRRQG